MADVTVTYYTLTPGPDPYGGVLDPAQSTPGTYAAQVDPDVVQAEPTVTLEGSCTTVESAVAFVVFPAGLGL